MLSPLAWTVLSALRKAQRIVRPAASQFVVGVILLAFAASLAMIASSSADEKLALPCDRASGLFAPDKKDIAMQLVSAAENSSINWKCQYRYIEYNVEKVEDQNRGYTAGIVGFTSKTGDLLEVVQRFVKISDDNLLKEYIPKLKELAKLDSKSQHRLAEEFVEAWQNDNLLKKYIPALKELAKLDSKSQHRLGEEFVEAWQKSDDKNRKAFREAQNFVRDEEYFNPAVCQAQCDRLKTLGQFIYYDAIVMHGSDPKMKEKISFDRIRADAMKKAKTPANGGDEAKYLNAFLCIRVEVMKGEADHKDNIDRVQNMQQAFLDAKNFDLNPPLSFKVNDDLFEIKGTQPN